MTRWHDDDLAGRLLKDQGPEWRVLRMPALAESQEERDINNKYLGLPENKPDPLDRKAGEPLAPRRFSRAALEEIKRDVGPLVWSAEYQGVPRPTEGSFFQRSCFGIVGAAPVGARRVRAWDKAATDGDGDYTVGLLLAEQDGVYYIEDVVRGQWSSFERQKVLIQIAVMDAERFGKIKWLGGNESIYGLQQFEVIDSGVSIWIEQEGGSGGKDSARTDISLLAGFSARVQSPPSSKIVRASPVAAQAEPGNIKIVSGSWNYALLEELAAFPNAAHDDQVDALSLSFSKLARPRFQRAYHGAA
jgi:phage terminase large subunit-like protein